MSVRNNEKSNGGEDKDCEVSDKFDGNDGSLTWLLTIPFGGLKHWFQIFEGNVEINYLCIIVCSVLMNESNLTSVGDDQGEAEKQEGSIDSDHCHLIVTLALSKNQHCDTSKQDVEKS